MAVIRIFRLSRSKVTCDVYFSSKTRKPMPISAIMTLDDGLRAHDRPFESGRTGDSRRTTVQPAYLLTTLECTQNGRNLLYRSTSETTSKKRSGGIGSTLVSLCFCVLRFDCSTASVTEKNVRSRPRLPWQRPADALIMNSGSCRPWSLPLIDVVPGASSLTTSGDAEDNSPKRVPGGRRLRLRPSLPTANKTISYTHAQDTRSQQVRGLGMRKK